MATEAAARKFFSASYFAVVGASSNPAKFGHKGKLSSPPNPSNLILKLVKSMLGTWPTISP
jgi:hypothetical protein